MNAKLDPLAQFQIEAIAQPELFLHVAIFVPGQAPVGGEIFRLVSFEGQDSSSDLFEYQLELHANTVTDNSPANSFNLDDLIGLPITVGIAYPSQLSQAEQTQRFRSAVTGAASLGSDLACFNGIIAAFSMADQGVYRITMKPGMARLKLSNAYQMHCQMNVRDTIANILDLYNISYSMQIADQNNLALVRVQDWLQAGETDFDFIMRLMGKAHLYYYFTHTATSHTIVFANSPAYPLIYPNAPVFQYCSSDINSLGTSLANTIVNYSYQRALRSSTVNGIFTRQYATWENQPYLTYYSQPAQKTLMEGDLPFYLFKSYQYGDTSDEVIDYTEATRAALEAESIQFSGTSFCAHFRAGHQFRLSSTASQDSRNSPYPVRPSFADCNFVITQVKHQANADGSYSNEFQATKASGLISKFSMQETQQGSLLAIVVGHQGQVAPPDWTHFAPANFDPEKSSFRDLNGSNPNYQPTGIYVTFCTDVKGQTPVFVKLGSSMQTVPEVGALVLVSRAQDESELPEVQNVIATDGSYCIMPTGWDASTRVGNNYSTAYGDSNAISFGQHSQADLANAVGIIKSQYGTGLFRDSSYSQGAGYSFSVAETQAASFIPNNGELWGPYGGATDILSASESSGSNYSRQYATVSSSFSNIGTAYSNSITGISESHALTTGTTWAESTQNGDITTISNINANSSNTSTHNGNASNTSTHDGDATNVTTQDGDTSNSSTQTGDTTSTSKQTGNVSNNSSNIGNITSVSLISGINSSLATVAMSDSTSITGLSISNDVTALAMRNSMVALSNSNSLTLAAVNLNMTAITMDTNLVGLSNSTSLRGLVNDTSLTGLSNNTSLTGLSTSTSLTGLSDQTALTGLSTSVSIEGVSNSMAIRGSSTQLNVSGNSNTINITGASTDINIHGPGLKFESGPAAVDMTLSGMSMQLISAIKLFL